MIEIAPDGTTSRDIGTPYSHSGKILGRFIMPITSRLRAHYAKKGIKNTGSHLDIGCGDCLFLLRSPCQKRVGLDLRYDDLITNELNFPDESFDNVSMLAFIEHLPDPHQLIREVHRVLRPEGHFIITTPRKAGDWLIKMYGTDIDKEEHGHEAYYNKTTMSQLMDGLFKLDMFRTFIFTLNQLFVYEKPLLFPK